MLLTLTADLSPGPDLGFLLHKHPDRFQSFDLPFGRAHVFYPEVGEGRATACLLLDVDPVGLVRDRPESSFALGQYVNDRPYVASSLMCVALSKVFGAAMNGRCDKRPDLVTAAVALTVAVDVVAVRNGGDKLIRGLFEPLGYAVEARRAPLDEAFPEWGESPYWSLTLAKVATVAEVLTHLYVMLGVFDNRKHYFVGPDEVEKLLAKGEGWLATHPLRDEIARRFLKSRPSLYREALGRLVTEEVAAEDETEAKALPEERVRLHDQRLDVVADRLAATGATSVVDLGCGEGKLLRRLVERRQFARIAGVDVTLRSLEIARERLLPEHGPRRNAERLTLLHGSLMYRDERVEGFDAAAVVEVVEHLDPPRLKAFERVVFGCARPGHVVLTTPNREYNAVFGMGEGTMRHGDHRFEWTRAEFAAWVAGVCERWGYAAEIEGVGPEAEGLGAVTQMAVFREESRRSIRDRLS